MDSKQTAIYEIVERGMVGKGLVDADIKKLYEVDPTSQEAFHVRWAGRELTNRAANGKAEVHAQIGLNGTPCPKNCQFCSFAICNGVRKGKLEMPLEDVVEYAKIYEEDGANAILVLTTATYSFEKLLEMSAAVRAAISKDLPLLANTGDMTLEQAQQLKSVGINGVYHAVRMGEGIFTTIPVETRLQTIKNVQEAGLSISTCVEPVGPEHTSEELVEKTRMCIDMNAMSAGLGRRIGIPGTAFYENGMITELTGSFLVAVYRLATGLVPRLNCSGHSLLTAHAGANLAWAEVGTNPRDTMERTEKGGRGQSLAMATRVFQESGWEILEGPSPG
ncbi:MAG: radical SAM protein, partial [Coriobacteriales bacterium]|nr:radical SAM protein [Coriobacteriales bacterium]